MKILIIGGMHGNEPLGLGLVEQLQKTPIKNIDAIIANEHAMRAGVRFVEQDLNRAFPGEDRSKVYEQRRAAELVELCRQYDVVLDFHNTNCPDNDCSFVGEGADKILLAASSKLGLKRVIVADYDCINKYAPNCLSVEISMTSNMNDWKIWLGKIRKLSELSSADTADDVTLYRFVYRMTLEDKERLDLPSENLQAFEPISVDLANALSVANPAYPIFIGDTFTPYNYGGILNKL